MLKSNWATHKSAHGHLTKCILECDRIKECGVGGDGKANIFAETREIRFMYECTAMHRHSFVLSSVDEFMNGIQTGRHLCAATLVTIQNNMHHAMGNTMKIHWIVRPSLGRCELNATARTTRSFLHIAAYDWVELKQSRCVARGSVQICEELSHRGAKRTQYSHADAPTKM